MRGRTLAFLALWALALVVALTRTLDGAHAGLLAAVASGFVLAWPKDLPAEPRLPTLPAHSHQGGRADLSQLSWTAFDAEGRAADKAMARLGSLTEGSEALAGLRHQMESGPRPRSGQILRWLDLIDHQGEK